MPLSGHGGDLLGHIKKSFEYANDNGGCMKGRRKLKTAKWALEARLIRHSKAILTSEEHALRRGRFLSKAEAASAHDEPVGILAGVSCVRDNKVKAAE